MAEDSKKKSANVPGPGGAMEYYSFERVLKELQMEEDELKRLVSEGEIRAFRDEDKMKFRKSDIDGLKKGRMTEPTIILPTGESEDSSEDSEVLLVEEDTSETLLDIDDLEGADSGSSTTVPTVDLTSGEFSDDSSSGGASSPSASAPSSSASETITEELTFQEDSGSYVLESSDDVLIDSSAEVKSSESKGEDSKGDTFINSDTGLQTEPLNMENGPSLDMESGPSLDLDSGSEKPATKAISAAHEEPSTLPTSEAEPEITGSTGMVSVPMEPPLSPVIMFCLIAATVVLLFSGMFMINIIKEVDTETTGFFTDMAYQIVPAKHIYEKGKLNENKLNKHIRTTRPNWRKTPGSLTK